MKLWHISQWGNADEGPNGRDTNCIVRAPNLETAIKLAESEFEYLDWKDGQCDVAYLIGEDYLLDDQPKVIIGDWIAHAYNLGGYTSWHRHPVSEKWMSEEDLFGPDPLK